jgi:hypothetical protein
MGRIKESPATLAMTLMSLSGCEEGFGPSAAFWIVFLGTPWLIIVPTSRGMPDTAALPAALFLTAVWVVAFAVSFFIALYVYVSLIGGLH